MPTSESGGLKTAPKLVTGNHGVYLKEFEKVLVDVLPKVRPVYSRLPSKPSSSSIDWPFDELPTEARVLGSKEGQISDPFRAKRKEDQIRSLFRCIFYLLPKNFDNIHYTIVDFGGGSGHLSIPLALYLPHCQIICVDLGKKSLDLLHEKADRCPPVTQSPSSAHVRTEICLQQCKTIPNLYTFHGSVEMFDLDFDMGVALHLCGQSTDVALRKCQKAQAIAVSPCCVGKINNNRKNPYIYQATGVNTSTVNYPQSSLLCQLIPQVEHWNHLAKAADYSEISEFRTHRNALRRTAKAVLETDRRCFLEESYGFTTTLTRMDPWEATPKNDILLAWKEPRYKLRKDDECNADVELAIEYLTIPKDTIERKVENDWTASEEERVRVEIETHLPADDKGQFVFPAGMGRRKRKLIHSVAEAMGLSHWGIGSSSSERAVAVARKLKS